MQRDCHYHADDDPDHHGRDRRHFQHDAGDHDDERRKRDGRDGERVGQARQQRLDARGDIGAIATAHLQADNGIHDGGDYEADATCRRDSAHDVKHAAIDDGGDQIVRIGERRHVAPEVRPRNDGACHKRSRQPEGKPDTHESKAHGADGAPRPDGKRHDRTDDESRHEEKLRVYDEQAVVDERRHRPRRDPHADEHAYEEEYEHGFKRRDNALHQAFQNLIPRITANGGDDAGNRTAEHERDLGLAAKSHHSRKHDDGHREHAYQSMVETGGFGLWRFGRVARSRPDA